MATATTKSGNSGIFWMNGVSDDEQPLVLVPGVDGEMKMQTSFSLGRGITSRTGTKMPARRNSDCKKETTLKKGGKKQGFGESERSGAYIKEKVSVRHPATVVTEHAPFPATGAFPSSSQVVSESSKTRNPVCMKDLCPEDKRRIAHLVEELARVSGEREESVQRLKDEQETFECKIQQLEQQNLIIAQERESLQQQYKECQELLGLYQQYLTQQQAKLNQSIAQLSQAPAHSKVLSSEEAPSRANGSLFDGSYLSFTAARAQQPEVSRSSCGGKVALQMSSNADSVPSVSEYSPTDGLIKRQRSQRSQRRQCRESHLKCEHCQDSGYGTQRRRNENGSHVGNKEHHTFSQKESQSGNGTGSEAKESTPEVSQEDWEEKRHQLLLQKMQLEMERERLQARLAEQEERLRRQNQQLHQSRLDYSRFQLATKTDRDPQPTGPSHSPSSMSEDPEVHTGRQSLHENPLQTQANGALQQSKKDMATSPVMSPMSLRKPTSVSATQSTPEARSDFSVVELLDIFTPVSAPDLSKPSLQGPKTSQCRPAPAAHKPMGRTLRTPVGPYPQHAQQDLEESQILEDIFFIC
ncbi:protein hinderin [Xyrichtys novacula]|uniref:Protein hinderin n=1 Tax=Xyrichtys novacula TaxID=13765 RepID=A0AAV1ERT0_XYRNO|nr:protein hinderin [Xyrichtys novacula]